MLCFLPEILPASQAWCTLVQPMDLNSVMTLKSLPWHPGFGEGRGPCRSAQSIRLVFITGLVSVKAGTVCLLLSAFYFQKRIPCLLVHSRCSVFIQCVKDRKVLGSLKFALGSALLISLYLCRFNFFFFLLMCTLYSRHNRRHEDIAINIGSCFQGTHTADFPH